MKPRTGSTKTKIAETAGIIHLYPHMKVSQSFGEIFSGASSPRFHPRALISEQDPQYLFAHTANGLGNGLGKEIAPWMPSTRPSKGLGPALARF